MTSPLHLIAHIDAQPGQAEAVEAALRELVAASRSANPVACSTTCTGTAPTPCASSCWRPGATTPHSLHTRPPPTTATSAMPMAAASRASPSPFSNTSLEPRSPR